MMGAASSTGPAPDGGTLLGDGITAEWELRTSSLTDNYARLALLFPGEVMVPAVPVHTDPEVCILAIPADTCPWLPSRLVPMGAEATGVRTADGAHIPVSMLVLGREAIPALIEASDDLRWSSGVHSDPRWPAASGFDGFEYSVFSPDGEGEVPVFYERALPPAPHAVSHLNI